MICRKCNKEAPVGALFCPFCGLRFEPIRKPRRGKKRANGSGTAIKRGHVWYSRVVVGWKPREDGCPVAIYRTKGGFETKTEALQYCQELLKPPVQKAQKTATMRQIYESWLEVHEKKVGKSTMDCYKAAWRYFAPLHDVPFDSIDLDALQECVDDCPHGKRTKENMKALAGLMYKFALPRHYTDMNYAQYIFTGTDEKTTHPAFTPEQVKKIYGIRKNFHYADYVLCLIYTGFRPAELFALRKEDFRDGILYGGMKTEAGKDRAVPVSKKILSIVREHMSSSSPWLFPKLDGSQMSPNYFRDFCFYQVLEAAGIQDVPSPGNPAYYVPYSCRHTFANLLKNAVGSDKDKAALIGHADYRTTKRLYQSAELDALKAIVAEI